MSEVESEVEPEVEPEPESETTSAERRLHHETAMRLVRQYPDPALRVAARPVPDVTDEVRRLAERMTDIMRRSHGVGLAAPQIGVLHRVLVYRVGPDDPGRVLVNPQLSDLSDEKDTDTEGCLSLLGGELSVPVERSQRLVAEGLDETGAQVRIEAEGFEARVLQHEIDHLDGVLIIDRTDKDARREAMRELRLKA
jgi:peptide deformylase